MIDPVRAFDEQLLSGEPPPEQSGDALRGAVASVSPSVEEPKLADVAVVFVHGMGTSNPGDMLESYMNPSLEWIKRATTDDHNWYLYNDFDTNLIEGVNILDRDRMPQKSGASEKVEQATDTASYSQASIREVDIGTLNTTLLNSTETTPGIFQPPYLDVDLVERRVEGGPESITTKKLVAIEAWWDGEFEAPAFREVAQWALGVAPSLILRHLALQWDSHPGTDAHTLSLSKPNGESDVQSHALNNDLSWWEHVLRFLRAIAFTIIGGFVAILFQWIVCLLLVFGAVPFLRNYISKIIFAMTTSFGDVLVYVHDGVRSAAIRSTVLRSFQWLSRQYQVQKLIVIGHSLGSVIAYDTLNYRDLRGTNLDQPFIRGDVSFVTFGSPLKKVNVLLNLKRDEQRVSLGMLFATFSLWSALAAVFFHVRASTPADELNRWEWIFIVTVAVSSVALGIGAHLRPVPFSLSGFGGNHALSYAQFLGLALGMVSMGILLFEPESGWRFLSLLALGVFLARAHHISRSRVTFEHSPDRPSQSLWFSAGLLGAVAVAMVTSTITTVTGLLLVALIFSIMSGANPLEEFRLEGNGAFARQLPKFSFRTPIKRWIDFWATHDPVAEFGLDNATYRKDLHSPFAETVISRRMTNVASLLHDHTTYRHNIEQFIAPLTRLFLEELGFRDRYDPTSGNLEWTGRHLGFTPVSGVYEQDICNTMQSRASRMRWLGLAGGLLMLTMLLFSPMVYRSIGEYIVFDEDSPARIVGEPRVVEGAPAWFNLFYNEYPRSCTDALCRIRHLPILPNAASKNLIANEFTGNIIVYGLGYLVMLGVAGLLARVLLTFPWKAWELAILDSLLQKNIDLGGNRIIRGAVFFTAVAMVAAFVVSVNTPWLSWLGMDWVWDNEISPLHTIGTFLGWFFKPLANTS